MNNHRLSALAPMGRKMAFATVTPPWYENWWPRSGPKLKGFLPLVMERPPVIRTQRRHFIAEMRPDFFLNMGSHMIWHIPQRSVIGNGQRLKKAIRN